MTTKRSPAAKSTPKSVSKSTSTRRKLSDEKPAPHPRVDRGVYTYSKGPRAGVGGRPTGFTDAVAEQLMDLVAHGEGIQFACEKAGVKIRTLHSWLELRPDFSRAFAAAREMGAEFCEAEAIKALREVLHVSSKEDGARVQAAHNYAHHMRWRASKLRPKVYGDRVQIDQKSEVTLKDERDQLRDKVLAAAQPEPEAPPAVH